MPVEGDTEAMSEIEKAIMYWEELKQEAIDMIAEGKYSNSVLEKQIPMCNTALAALREQAERSRGCEWYKALSFNPDIGGCQLVFFKSKKHPKGEHAISVSVFDEYGEEQEPVLVQIDNCIRCGKRLEVEP